MSTTMCSLKPAVPPAHAVERLLYVLARHETDALRETVLPINEPTGKILFAQYQKERLTLRFLTHTRVPTTLRRYTRETVFRALAKERGWFFRWEGCAIGLTRLTHAEVAALAYHRCHDDRKSTIHVSRLVDQRLIQLADKHLYPTHSLVEGAAHASC